MHEVLQQRVLSSDDKHANFLMEIRYRCSHSHFLQAELFLLRPLGILEPYPMGVKWTRHRTEKY